MRVALIDSFAIDQFQGKRELFVAFVNFCERKWFIGTRLDDPRFRLQKQPKGANRHHFLRPAPRVGCPKESQSFLLFCSPPERNRFCPTESNEDNEDSITITESEEEKSEMRCSL